MKSNRNLLQDGHRCGFFHHAKAIRNVASAIMAHLATDATPPLLFNSGFRKTSKRASNRPSMASSTPFNTQSAITPQASIAPVSPTMARPITNSISQISDGTFLKEKVALFGLYCGLM